MAAGPRPARRRRAGVGAGWSAWDKSTATEGRGWAGAAPGGPGAEPPLPAPPGEGGSGTEARAPPVVPPGAAGRGMAPRDPPGSANAEPAKRRGNAAEEPAVRGLGEGMRRWAGQRKVPSEVVVPSELAVFATATPRAVRQVRCQCPPGTPRGLTTVHLAAVRRLLPSGAVEAHKRSITRRCGEGEGGTLLSPLSFPLCPPLTKPSRLGGPT